MHGTRQIYLNIKIRLKIGYTTRTAEQRISEQASQIIIAKKELWHYDFRFMNGQGYFKDRDFHNYLTRIKQVPKEKGSEWFDYTPDMSKSERDFKTLSFNAVMISLKINKVKTINCETNGARQSIRQKITLKMVVASFSGTPNRVLEKH